MLQILPRRLIVLSLLVIASACQHAAAPGPLRETRALGPDAVGPAHAADLAEVPTRTTLPDKPPRLVISEVLVDPLLLEDVAGEFVEVVNLSPAAVRLPDLEVALPSGKVAVPERPALPVLRPGEVLLLTPLGKGRDEARLRGLRLPNQAGRLELRWRGHLVDVVQWHKKRPWPKQKPGYALERTAPDSDGMLGSSWRHASAPLRGIERATPGRLTWACERVRDTPVWAMCVQEQKKAPKTRNRAHECTRSAGVAEGGLEPST
jgi:hypothetical protein